MCDLYTCISLTSYPDIAPIDKHRTRGTPVIALMNDINTFITVRNFNLKLQIPLFYSYLFQFSVRFSQMLKRPMPSM